MVRQRDELGEALRTEAAGMEAQYKVEILKLGHHLNSVSCEVERVTTEKEEVESTLSIVHADFFRAEKMGCARRIIHVFKQASPERLFSCS